MNGSKAQTKIKGKIFHKKQMIENQKIQRQDSLFNKTMQKPQFTAYISEIRNWE